MSKIEKIALIKQMLEGAEKSIQTARQLLAELSGGQDKYIKQEDMKKKLKDLNVSEEEKVVEGIFNGQNMIGSNEREYPVPANYASKSKLAEGDTLKLTIKEDGSFVYKQIGPIERKKIIGTLMQEDEGDYKVIAEGKTYKVLLASVTYFKAEPGDEVTLVVPKDQEATWGAIENVIKKAGTSSDSEKSKEEPSLEDLEEIERNKEDSKKDEEKITL